MEPLGRRFSRLAEGAGRTVPGRYRPGVRPQLVPACRPCVASAALCLAPCLVGRFEAAANALAGHAGRGAAVPLCNRPDTATLHPPPNIGTCNLLKN